MHVLDIDDYLIQDSCFAKFYLGFYWQQFRACTEMTEFQVGLLYDEVSLQNVLDMTADWTPEERLMLRNKVMCSVG